MGGRVVVSLLVVEKLGFLILFTSWEEITKRNLFHKAWKQKCFSFNLMLTSKIYWLKHVYFPPNWRLSNSWKKEEMTLWQICAPSRNKRNISLLKNGNKNSLAFHAKSTPKINLEHNPSRFSQLLNEKFFQSCPRKHPGQDVFIP